MKGSIFLPGEPLERRLDLRRQQATLVRSERLPAAARRALSGAPFGGGQTDGWAGGRRETAHNATTAADYRTALLSDSPQCGCSLCPAED
jgi:hypothetical protein